MKRLLTFARPYWVYLAISVVLLFLIVFIDLARPYIIKIAIDDHINGYNTPMVVFQRDEKPDVKGIHFDDKVFVRETTLEDDYPDRERYQMIMDQGNYYLIEGVIDTTKEFEVISRESGYTINQFGETFKGVMLDREAVKIFRSDDVNSIIRLSLFFLLILLIGFVLNYGQIFLLTYTSQRIIYSMRIKIFSHLESQSLSFFDQNPVGRLVTRVTNDTETLNEMYTNVLVNLFKDVFLLVGIVIVMFKLNYHLALIAISILPIVVLASFVFRKKVRNAYREVRKHLAKINASLSENISGMRIVQIFNQENKKYKEFESINTDYYDASMVELKIFALYRPFINVLYYLTLSLVVWYGGGRLIQGTLEFGVVFAFISYVELFFRPIDDLTEKYNILQSAMASSERIFGLLDQNPDISNSENPIRVSEIKGKIEFKNVWFAYNDEDWVLKDVSFIIEPGEKIAFVGATGAGKSSIMSLLTRFYDIQKGEILVDGMNIKDFDISYLRRFISVVLQDVFLFTGDIKSNIRLNSLEINDERIRKVSEVVNAHSFINKMKSKYDEPVNERGTTLSSGQRQLLSYARALAFDPKVLILDEATANIDSDTEILIQDALPKLMEGRTTIIVAHRLSTIQKCDKIIVLHKGRISESGTHQQLLGKKGIYWNLYKLQYKDNY